MSGAQNTFPFPVTANANPPEGSKAVTVTVNWPGVFTATAGGFSTIINLLSQFQSGQFVTVQSVYIDNSTCAYAVSLVCSETQARVIAAPFTIGMYPILVGPAAQFQVTIVALPSNAATLFPLGSTTFNFLNTPQRYFQSQGIGTGANFLSQNIQISLGSGTPTFVLLPQLSGGQRYALTSAAITVVTAIGATAFPNLPSIIVVGINETASNVYLVRDSIYIPAASPTGVLYQRYFSFPTPVIQIGTAGLSITLSPSGNLSNNMQVQVGITYNVITIN